MSDFFNGLLRIINTKTTVPIFKVKNNQTGKINDIDQSYVIPFFRTYCDALDDKITDWNIHPVFTFSEVVKDSCIPIISDFTFEFDHIEEKDEPIYEDELIHGMISIQQDIIKELFKTSSSFEEFICIVLMSEIWDEGKKSLFRVRFHFPYCRTGTNIIDKDFRNKFLQRLRKDNLVSKFYESPIGDWSTQYETTKNEYTMYGSTDSEKKPPLRFEGAYFLKSEERILCTEMKIEDVFRPHTHSFFRKGKCDTEDLNIITDVEDIVEGSRDYAIFFIPVLLSLNFKDGITKFKDSERESPSTRKKEKLLNFDEDSEDEEESVSYSDIDICNELIPKLSDIRFSKENYFKDIGKALFTSYKGDYEGLNTWIKYCETRSSTFTKENCEEWYDEFFNENIAISCKTIAWYAKEDNPEYYETWHSEWCHGKLIQALETDHDLVAQAFYRVFWLHLLCDDKKWYEFRGNSYKKLSKEFPVRRFVSDTFISYFDNLNSALIKEKAELSSGNKASKKHKERYIELEKQIENVSKLIRKLRDLNFKNKIIEASKEYFYVEDIKKFLNRRPEIFAVKNGIIELVSNEAIFRKGKPEDYVTKTAGVRFRTDYTKDHKDIKHAENYLKMVFPEESIKHFMKKDGASYLYRQNREKLVRFWIGETNGSKSVYQKILRTMVGEYYCDIPPSLYSAQSKGGGPNPELAQAEGTALAFTAEADDDESFKGARLKKYAGGSDSFFARLCNEDGGSIETSFKNIFPLNCVPTIEGLDEAVKLRFMMTPFEGRWVDKKEVELFKTIPETLEEQVKAKLYPMEVGFDNASNISRLATALLWIFFHYYRKYASEGLEPPKYMKTFMDDYWKRNDPLLLFIIENLENPKKKIKDVDGNIIEVTDKEKSMTGGEVYRHFKKWFKDNYPNDKPWDQPKFITKMESRDRLGKQVNRRWMGIQLKISTPDLNNLIQ